jgi:hypothetical protein
MAMKMVLGCEPLGGHESNVELLKALMARFHGSVLSSFHATVGMDRTSTGRHRPHRGTGSGELHDYR